MARAASELDGQAAMRERGAAHFVTHAGVQHHSGVDAFECTRVDQASFAGTAAFLGGRADHEDGAFDLRDAERGAQSEANSDTGDRDQVVAAGVTDRRKCVVLAERCDDRSAITSQGPEGRVQAVRRPPHLEAGVLEVVRQCAVGVCLFVTKLGMGVDVERERAQLLGRGVDGVQRGLLGGGEGQGWCPSYSVGSTGRRTGRKRFARLSSWPSGSRTWK